jgi:predicted DsbA family dithiol-disulfide isomerase
MPHPVEYAKVAPRSWTNRREEKNRRIQRVSSWMNGPMLPREKLVESLELLIVSGDRIVLEGDNQKQADFLSRSLVKVDPKKVHDLHLIISSISRPEHFCHGVSRAFFTEHADISKREVIVPIADRFGISASEVETAWHERRFSPRVDAFIEDWHKVGVTGVPAMGWPNRRAIVGMMPPTELVLRLCNG